MLAGLICPKSTERSGKKTTWDECLSKDCEGCYPYPVRKAIYESIEKRDRWFSPSSLLMCLRKAKWEHEKDYYVKPSNAYWLMRGSYLHEILEKSASDDAIVEKIVTRDIPGTDITLKGQVDHYKDGVLTDYKTVVDSGFNVIKKQGIKDSHIWQTNIYKWMMSSNYNVEEIRIVYVGMSNVITTGQDNVMSSWGNDNISNIETCPVYTDSKVLNMVKQRANLIIDRNLPPADSSKKWLCNVCPFKEECFSV